ncbi:hypothetical protein TYRP_003126 [Tyrophagus putrescentiae]|nr:hypothetical protein TYRP_003126 [Tyrophagus putrescentiae]
MSTEAKCRLKWTKATSSLFYLFYTTSITYDQVDQHGRHLWVRSQEKGVVKDKGKQNEKEDNEAGHVSGGGLGEDGHRQVVPIVRLSEDVIQQQTNASHQQVGVVGQAKGRQDVLKWAVNIGGVRPDHGRRGGVGAVAEQQSELELQNALDFTSTAHLNAVQLLSCATAVQHLDDRGQTEQLQQPFLWAV